MRRQYFLLLLLLATALLIGCAGVTGAANNSSPAKGSANLALGAKSLDFGSVSVGTTETDTLVVTNAATSQSINVSQVSVTGTRFTLSSALKLPIALAPAQSVSLSVTFCPTAAGSASGSLSITSDASDPNLTVPLSGSGLTAGQLGVTPSAVSFGNVGVGSSASQQGTLTTGNSAITVSSANWTGQGYSLSGISFPATVPAGQSVPFTVTFAPTVTGPSSGNVSFVSNASNPPTIETFTGTGIQDYYVSTTGNDSNNGSQSSPWRTIQYAANHIPPGAMVHVAPGTYAEAVDINIKGTTSANPIWFVSDTQWAAKVTGTISSNYTFYVESDYVGIAGFEITDSNPSEHEGILDIGSYFYAVGNKVHDIAQVGGSDGLGGAGILLGNDQGVGKSCCGYALENVVYNIGNFTVPWASIHGIYIEEPYGIIANNITYENQGCGIQLWHNPTNIVVANNTIFSNGLCGIVIGATFTPPDSIADYNDVFNNIVVYNGTNSDANCGIWEDGNTGTHNHYPNNLAYQNNPSGTSDFCLLNGNTAPNSVVADPLFVNYQADGSGDYHLQSTSPAIDSGVNYLGYGPAIDFVGGSRPIGTSWDIGAYEFGSPPATWSWPLPSASAGDPDLLAVP